MPLCICILVVRTVNDYIPRSGVLGIKYVSKRDEVLISQQVHDFFCVCYSKVVNTLCCHLYSFQKTASAQLPVKLALTEGCLISTVPVENLEYGVMMYFAESVSLTKESIQF